MRPLALPLLLLALPAAAQEKPAPEAPARVEATTTVVPCAGEAPPEAGGCVSGEREVRGLERVARGLALRPMRAVRGRVVLRHYTLDLRRERPVEVTFAPFPPAFGQRRWDRRERDDDR